MDGEGANEVATSALGERLGALRLCEASALEALRRSLRRHGQLSAAVGFLEGDSVQLIDGFKRLRAARSLGWETLRTRLVSVDATGAALMIPSLHVGRGLTELEEGWLVRLLYREQGLQQSEIAQRLQRHKSWVSRRLMLVESLDAAVQADLRLGLLAPRAAMEVAQLPRGNQQACAEIVIRRGLTVRQTALLVAELLDCGDAATREQRLLDYSSAAAVSKQPGVRRARAAGSEADWLAADVTTLRQIAGRLQARLLAAPVATHGPEVAELIVNGLRDLDPLLLALSRTIQSVVTTGRAVA